MRMKSGFTLIEILAALSILAIAVSSLVIVRNNSIDVASEAIQVRICKMLAEQKMGELMAKIEKRRAGKFADKKYSAYTWKTKSKKITETATGEDGQVTQVELKRIVLTVTSTSGRSQVLEGIILLEDPESGEVEKKNEKEE